jgi:hypothetical protein
MTEVNLVGTPDEIIENAQRLAEAGDDSYGGNPFRCQHWRGNA